MVCSCCEQAVHVVQEEAGEVRDTLETAVEVVEQVAEDVAEEANRAAEVIAEEAEELVEEAKELAETVVEEVQHASSSGLHILKDFMEAKVVDTVRLLLRLLPPVIKKVTDDPEAPKASKETKDKMIDLLWPDVEKEILLELTADLFGLPDENEDGTASCCACAKMRYRLYPYNRGLAGVQQDPVWWICAIIAAFPLFSLPAYFFLIIFFIIDKTDEFQLLFFILQVRGMQFLSDGFLQVYLRYVQYFICMMAGVICSTESYPGGEVAVVMDITGYILRALMVWCSVILLHTYSEQKRPKNLNPEADMAIKTFRSGKLHYFLILDTLLSIGGVSTLITVYAQMRDADTKEFKGAISAVEVVHGILCVGFFVLLAVPLLRNVVLHTFPTGYDKLGRCRNYIGPQIRAPKPNPEARVNFLKDALKWDEIEGLMAKVKSSFLGVTDSLKSA